MTADRLLLTLTALDRRTVQSFHHGPHQRSKLSQTGTMVQIQRWKPEHEADVRGGSRPIQQVQVKYTSDALPSCVCQH